MAMMTEALNKIGTTMGGMGKHLRRGALASQRVAGHAAIGAGIGAVGGFLSDSDSHMGGALRGAGLGAIAGAGYKLYGSHTVHPNITMPELRGMPVSHRVAGLLK